MNTINFEELEGLDGFEKLDIADVHYVGESRFTESGLSYYRQFAVENLEWDQSNKVMTALVQGRRHEPYKVSLRVSGGNLLLECECSDWVDFGNCKHCVAASAAMFLAVQGQSVAGYDMPDDYAQELRKQLGYSDVGGAGHIGEEQVEELVTEFLLTDVDIHGGLSFTIEGTVPQSFLNSFGITLDSSYGFRLSREFILFKPEDDFIRFLRVSKLFQIIPKYSNLY